MAWQTTERCKQISSSSTFPLSTLHPRTGTHSATVPLLEMIGAVPVSVRAHDGPMSCHVQVHAHFLVYVYVHVVWYVVVCTDCSKRM